MSVGVCAFHPQCARWILNYVPGVYFPDAVIERLERASNPQDEGKQISIKIIRELRDIEGVAGIHVMVYHQEHTIAEIVERSGVLEGWACWYPERDAT